MEYVDGTNAFKATKHGAFRVVESPLEDFTIESASNTTTAQAFVTVRRSRTPLTATATMDTQYTRLGHIGKEALKNVPYVVDRVALSTRDFERTLELCPEY